MVPPAAAADLHDVDGEVGVQRGEPLELVRVAGPMPAACRSASPKTHETSVSRSLRQTGHVCSVGSPWNRAARSR